jgi:Tfp pilus assembly protein PilX
MKNLIAIFVSVLCLLIIIIGNFQYERKLETISKKAAQEIEINNNKEEDQKENDEGTFSEDNEESSNLEDENNDSELSNELELTDEQIQWMVGNLPEQLQKTIIKKIHNSETINVVAMGSESTSPESTGWPALLNEELNSAYGESTFEVEVVSFGKKNSMEVVNEWLYETIYDMDPDILLFEPFMLRDNGTVRIEHTLENITTMINNIKSELPETTIFLQPSHPIYLATFYPIEIAELEKYAEQNDYLYLDHWTAWPDHQSEEITSYITEDSNSPTEKGHEVWAEYLSEYFIASE